MSRRQRVTLHLALAMCFSPSAMGQAKGGKPAPAAPASPAAPAAPAPLTAEQKVAQKQAVAEFTRGQELERAGDLDGAIAQYDKAFALYPDPELQFLLGESQRKKGDQAADFALYQRAIGHYRRYLELAPQGRAADSARQRIAALEAGIARDEADRERRAADERAATEARAAEARQLAERQRAEREGTQLALDISLTAGSEPDLSGIARLVAGGLLGWGRFAVEGHIGFAGFLQIRNAQGVAARELTLLDLGARYAFRSHRFVGPFVAAGGSFGLITGKPRERKLEDDPVTCRGIEGDDCAFAIDKDLTGRIAFGYGFESSPKTTVAARLDLSYLMFSVDGEQGLGAPAARQVDKPQGMLAVLIGLEFMHWP